MTEIETDRTARVLDGFSWFSRPFDLLKSRRSTTGMFVFIAMFYLLRGEKLIAKNLGDSAWADDRIKIWAERVERRGIDIRSRGCRSAPCKGGEPSPILELFNATGLG